MCAQQQPLVVAFVAEVVFLWIQKWHLEEEGEVVPSLQLRRSGAWPGQAEDAAVELSIKFIPQYPGRYPCQILLQSKYDIRIYNIECVVNTDTVEAELEFVTPAYQAVIQDIPIVCLLYMTNVK
ncbi:UNVERIFIED_CONTAM: hypothetical protein K2H54_051960 [Gekko kuhli]